MSIEHYPEPGPESSAAWRNFDNIVEALLFADLGLLRHAANQLSDTVSPFATELEAFILEYESNFGEAETLERSTGTQASEVGCAEESEIFDELTDAMRVRTATVEDIMVAGLRTLVYADMETHSNLKPALNENVFYLAAATAGQRMDDAADWIVSVLYPDDELLGDIAALEDAPLTTEDAKLDIYRGLSVLCELGLANLYMKSKLKFLEKTLFKQT